MALHLGIYWRHGIHTLRRQGPGALVRLIQRRVNRLLGRYQPGHYDFGYERWRNASGRDVPPTETPTGDPLFSIIVPVYNVSPGLLQETVDSIRAQRYANWECILTNDGSSQKEVAPTLDHIGHSDSRFRVLHLAENLGIAGASAKGLELCGGDYIVLLDHDDLLSSDALQHVALLLDRDPAADLIYSDEDKVDMAGRRSAPFFKPDFSPTLLCSQNYLSHLLVMKRSLALEVGGFRSGFDGAQDYDLVLRASRSARAIRHIPRVLYHWRQVPGSTALDHAEKGYADDAGRRALQSHLDVIFPGAEALPGSMAGTWRIHYPINGTPLISIIIPFRDKPGLLDSCLTALFTNTQRVAFEVVCADNDSADPAIPALKARWTGNHDNVRFVAAPGAFNFSAICNDAVAESSGDFVVLLNNDVVVKNPDWLERLLGHAQQSDVGAVGGRLIYPDGTVQHAGIVPGIGSSAGHPFKGFRQDLPGYFGRLQIASDVSAVTGALLMVARAKWDAAGGLDAVNLGVALNDVDFCLRLAEAGLRNVLEPGCTAVHAESASRGPDSDPARRDRLLKEVGYFQHRWAEFLATGDPYYNPNLTLDAEDYSLNWALANQHPTLKTLS